MDLTKACNEVYHGGLVTVEYIPIEDVESVPDAVGTDSTITTAVVLKAGKAWYSVSVPNDTFDFDENRAEGIQGEMYEKEVSGFLAVDNAAVRSVISEMNARRFLLKCKDSNGLIRLLGSLEYPYRFTSKLTKNKDFRQGAGHSLLFKSASPYMDLFMNI